RQRPPTEVRPRALIRDDCECRIADDLAVAEPDPEPWAPVVVVPQPRVDGRCDEQRVRAVALEERSPLDLRDHGGVQAEPGVEEEAPPVGDAQPDAPEVAAGERLDETLCRLDGVVGHADAPREHVGGPARQRRQRGAGAGEPVRGLAEGPVAAEYDDDLDSVDRSTAG